MLAATYFIDTGAVMRLARAGMYTALLLVVVALAFMAAPVVVALLAIVLPVLAKLAVGALVIAVYGWATYPRKAVRK